MMRRAVRDGFSANQSTEIRGGGGGGGVNWASSLKRNAGTKASLINILQVCTEGPLSTSKLSSSLRGICSCSCPPTDIVQRRGRVYLSARRALLKTEDLSYSWYYFRFQGQRKCSVLVE